MCALNYFQLLLCNFLAQTEALMKGKGAEQVEAELKKAGKSEEEIAKIKPHKVEILIISYSRRSSNKIWFGIPQYTMLYFCRGLWRLASMNEPTIGIGPFLFCLDTKTAGWNL